MGGGKLRIIQGEPQPARITVSEFRDYLEARLYGGAFLVEMLDDCLTIEAIYLRLAREDIRARIKRMN